MHRMMTRLAPTPGVESTLYGQLGNTTRRPYSVSQWAISASQSLDNFNILSLHQAWAGL